jgi:hypothetical protein
MSECINLDVNSHSSPLSDYCPWAFRIPILRSYNFNTLSLSKQDVNRSDTAWGLLVLIKYCKMNKWVGRSDKDVRIFLESTLGRETHKLSVSLMETSLMKPSSSDWLSSNISFWAEPYGIFCSVQAMFGSSLCHYSSVKLDCIIQEDELHDRNPQANELLEQIQLL